MSRPLQGSEQCVAFSASALCVSALPVHCQAARSPCPSPSVKWANALKQSPKKCPEAKRSPSRPQQLVHARRWVPRTRTSGARPPDPSGFLGVPLGGPEARPAQPPTFTTGLQVPLLCQDSHGPSQGGSGSCSETLWSIPRTAARGSCSDHSPLAFDLGVHGRNLGPQGPTDGCPS